MIQNKHKNLLSALRPGGLYALHKDFKIEFGHNVLGSFQFIMKRTANSIMVSDLVVFLYKEEKLGFYHGICLSDGCRLFKLGMSAAFVESMFTLV
jgi:hypothetical protein